MSVCKTQSGGHCQKREQRAATYITSSIGLFQSQNKSHEIAVFILNQPRVPSAAGTLCVDRTQVAPPRTALLVVNSDVRESGRGPQHLTLDPQLRSMLQWVAASMADIPLIQLGPDRELQQVIGPLLPPPPPPVGFVINQLYNAPQCLVPGIYFKPVELVHR